eukprot:COSAG05_NODE_1312_length_5217_cov_2.233685_3_plen_121_part_00
MASTLGGQQAGRTRRQAAAGRQLGASCMQHGAAASGAARGVNFTRVNLLCFDSFPSYMYCRTEVYPGTRVRIRFASSCIGIPAAIHANAVTSVVHKLAFAISRSSEDRKPFSLSKIKNEL